MRIVIGAMCSLQILCSQLGQEVFLSAEVAHLEREDLTRLYI